jgi:hypothetical protein
MQSYSSAKTWNKIPGLLDQDNRNQNYLLAALPVAEFNRLAPYLDLLKMPVGEVVLDSYDKLEQVYFPTTAIVSLHNVSNNIASAEIAGVGQEGMLGIAQFIGDKEPPNRAFVWTAGYGYKLKARLLMDEFDRGGSMRHFLHRYTHALITQISQVNECKQKHSVVKQLCRWLLLALDRMSSSILTMKDKFVAGMLGVERQAIAEASVELQQLGVISYRRGLISVLDRLGLENLACECYCVVRKELNLLLGLDFDWRPMHESVMTWTRASTNVRA